MSSPVVRPPSTSMPTMADTTMTGTLLFFGGWCG
jgi:hypothetical protein